MNAFIYSENEEAAKPMRVPMIAIAGLSNEGAPGQRVQQVADVLEAHDLDFERYNTLKV